MKKVLLLFLLFLSCGSFAQIEQEEIESLWDNQIQAIIDLDKKALDKYCVHPPEGDWGYIIGLGEEDEWSFDQFLDHIDEVFFEELRAHLREGNSSYIELWEEDEDVFLVVKYSEIYVEEDMELETTLLLVFRKWDGEWKLTEYLIAG